MIIHKIKYQLILLINKISNVVISPALLGNAYNIEAELQRRALKDSVDYILEKMDDEVKSFRKREEVIDHAFSEIETKDGLYLEFGVWQGESINYLAKKTPTQVFGFDSFEGLPERWTSAVGKGVFAVDNLPKVRNNVTLIKGWFDKTLPEFLKDNKKNVSFLHIDCDLYSSTKTIFKLLKKQIRSGTVIVFDEYFNYPNWQKHEYKAFQEFITKNKLKYKYLSYCRYSGNVACKII